VGRAVSSVIRSSQCETVWITSGVPLGAMAPVARAAGARRIVVSTHGLEAGWASMPGVRQCLRMVSRSADVVTYLGDYTHRALIPAVAPGVRLVQLTGGVDAARFAAHPGGPGIRDRHGLHGRPVVVTVSRLVPRKGQDTLLRAWPQLRRCHPGAALVVIGEGYYKPALTRLSRRLGVADDVHFVGAVSDEELPAYLAAADVFAMPCRTQLGGMLLEGLGLITLEASASGLPVVVGRSGGAPDAVIHGETGLVLDVGAVVVGDAVRSLTQALDRLLADDALRKAMGSAGRDWVQARWSWDTMSDTLISQLVGPPGHS
jgi:phosphatidylinositol alpha-1,6-mannosyltransferase